MGADFIEKATPTFKKSWDRARVMLGTADLFTRQPSCAARTAAAEIVGSAKLNGSLRFRSGDHALTVDGSNPSLMTARTAQKPFLKDFLSPSRATARTVSDSHFNR